MQKSKRFEAMPVISLEEGRQIGTVKGLVVDPAARKVAALIIEQKGWFKEQRFIPYNRINSVGNDAITIEKSSGIEKAAGIPEIAKLLREKVPINGAKIVTDNGTALGYVDEYYVDLATGTIAGLEFSGSRLDSIIKGHAFIDINYVRTLGKEVIVVSSECLNNIIKLEGGLQETVKNLRESTGQFWE
ncbi:MAG TPA: PRC-barrel domain-containing protein, partial [Bacillota bacterium]|nr:PRC-barrel domain-containing protein [Bacillota bacterium]